MILVADFDETITQFDTIGILASIAYEKGSSKSLPPFSYFTQVYLNSYKAYTANTAEPTTIAAEIAYQQGMKKVELSSVTEMEAHGVFKGLKPKDITAGALSAVKIRAGFDKLCRRCAALKIPLIVLSVNWSSYMIQGFVPPGTRIICNELEVDKDGVTTGKFEQNILGIDGGIRTGYDKLQVIKQLKRQYNDELMYVGDSRGDLLSLLHSEVGVVVPEGRLWGSMPSGILNDWEQGRRNGMKPKLYKYDWSQVLEYLEQHHSGGQA